MSTKYWVGGAASGGTGTDSEVSFDAPDNWEGGVVPIAGDTIVFDGRANLCDDDSIAGQTEGLMWAPTQALDQITAALADVIVHASFTGNIGHIDTSDVYHYLELDCDNVYIYGSGELYALKATQTSADTKLYCSGDAELRLCNAASCGWEMMASTGSLYLDQVSGVDPSISSLIALGATFQVDTGGTIASLIQNAGSIYTEADITAGVVSGGYLYLGAADTDPDTSIDVTSLTVYDGEVLIRHLCALKEAAIYGGKISASTAMAVTLGHTTPTHISVYGGELDLSGAGYGRVSMATGAKLKKYLGGTVNLPPGSEAAW
jgi:hypothetical protein